MKIELVCTDSKSETAISIIIKTSKTGQVGDGKIFVYNVEEAVRIRTEESGESAI